MEKNKRTPDKPDDGLIWKGGILDVDAMINRDLGPFDWDLGGHEAPPVITPSLLEALDVLGRRQEDGRVGSLGAKALEIEASTDRQVS